MQISKITPISFGKIPIERDKTNVNIFKNVNCNNRSGDRYEASIKEDSGYTYIIDLKKGDINNPKSLCELVIDPNDSSIYTHYMSTNKDEKHNGLGSCLHLLSIVEMLENNMDSIDLYSLTQAIPFHIKMGFKCNGSWSFDLWKNINHVIQETDPRLIKYAEQAKAFKSELMPNKMRTEIGNEILTNYLRDAIKIKFPEEQTQLCPYSFYMKLTREDVLKNKEFYNELFKKYNIDYEI